jgi:hypothetical protein
MSKIKEIKGKTLSNIKENIGGELASNAKEGRTA